MPFSLLKYGLRARHVAFRDIPLTPELKRSYDVVIIGGGGHGLAAAYYLSNVHGIRNVAVLEKGYLAGGNTARNTTTIRSNYMTEESIRFYKEGVELFETMSQDLGFNVMFSQRGQLTLAHSEATLRSFHLSAEMGKHVGTRIEVVDVQTVKELCPHLNLDLGGQHEVMGGLWHADGGTARHDAVAWGYAKHASERGVEIHQRTEVTGFDRVGDRVTHIKTNRGTIAAGQVLQAVGGLNGQVAAMAGIQLPIRCFPLQAMVTQPLKPFLHILVSSANLHTYLVQSSRGEVVIGGGSDPYQLASTRSTLDQKEHLAEGALHLFPFLHKVKLLRQWAGHHRHDPGLQPDHGGLTAAKLLARLRMGDVGLQGDACGRQAHGRDHRQRARARCPETIRPAPVRQLCAAE